MDDETSYWTPRSPPGTPSDSGDRSSYGTPPDTLRARAITAFVLPLNDSSLSLMHNGTNVSIDASSLLHNGTVPMLQPPTSNESIGMFVVLLTLLVFIIGIICNRGTKTGKKKKKDQHVQRTTTQQIQQNTLQV
eukprot:1135697_1